MSKRHFIALADELRPVWASMTQEAQLAILRFCRQQNPAFNTQRWVDYVRGLCGPCGGKVKQPV